MSARVPSATTVDAYTACRAGVADRTSFGVVLPGTPVVTGTDCTVGFGASNDGSSLRMRQTDGVGAGMWTYGSGAIDTGFGTAGAQVISDVGAASSTARSLARLPDGDIVAGSRCDAAAAMDFCIARLNPDGTPDPAFNGGATRRIDFQGGEDSLRRVFVSPDGSIMAIGTCAAPAQRAMCVVKLGLDGSFVNAFDNDGKALYEVSGEDDYGKELLDAGHGRLWVSGDCALGGFDDFCLFLVDESTGAALAPFGTNGLRIPVGGGNDYNSGAELLPDGDVLMYGSCTGATAFDACAARVNPDATLHTSWAAGGKLLVDVGGGNTDIDDATTTPDGGIVIAGECLVQQPCAVRLRSDLTLDTAFSGDGMEVWAANSADDTFGGLLAQADGAVLQAGECNNVACLRRILPNGTLDSTWGPGGVRTYSVTGDDWAYDVIELDDGRIMISGGCNVDTSCVFRLLPGGKVDDYVTGGGTDRDWSSGAGTSMFGTCLRGIGGTGTASWLVGACDQVDGAQWRAVPAGVSTVATATAGTASASFRFGFRPASSTPASRYVAPVTFEVVGVST